MVSVGARFARASDAAPIARVHLAAALKAYANIFPPHAPQPTPAELTSDWVARIADPDTTVWVVEPDDAIVAAVAVTPDRSEPGTRMLTKLYVHPDHWGRGIGGSLLDQATAHERELGTTRLHLWVLEANTRARQIYERRGWQLVAGRTLTNEPSKVPEALYRLDL